MSFARSAHRAKGWATCPITQAAFVRIVSNPAFSRDAVQPRDAVRVLTANTAAKDHAFWPDELPVAEAVAFTGVRLMGHQQGVALYAHRFYGPANRAFDLPRPFS